MKEFQTGYVALIGQPNTGKSTLMNALLGEKISITADRPQTTRHQILGIKTTDQYQCIFVDTPGLHQDQKKKAINRYMNRAANSVVKDVDCVVLLMDVNKVSNSDFILIDLFPSHVKPIVVLNKIDKKDKADILPVIKSVSENIPDCQIVPVSALNEENLDRLLEVILAELPFGVPHFPSDQLTDKPMKFIVAEIVREKLFRILTQELPYSVTVNVEHYKEETDLTRISASIWVERKSQKGIVIGQGGKLLKKIGSAARTDIEKLIDQKCYLQLWVKVRTDWSDDEKALSSFGYQLDS